MNLAIKVGKSPSYRKDLCKDSVAQTIWGTRSYNKLEFGVSYSTNNSVKDLGAVSFQPSMDQLNSKLECPSSNNILIMQSEQIEGESVKVLIRIKPSLSSTRALFLDPQQSDTILLQSQHKRQYFTFDHVAGQNSTQQEIYFALGLPLVNAIKKGYNGCVFAYGQTGAGKTHSILGSDPEGQNRGLLPRILQELFREESKTKVKQVSCSYLQVIQQKAHQLKRDNKNLSIHQDPSKTVYVDALTEFKLDSLQKALDLLRRGQASRKVAFTEMNAESSRSHSIFTINVRVRKEEDQDSGELLGKLHVIDLAGSQRQKNTGAEGQRLKQGCNINKSLTVLGNVINSLLEKKKHIPFRDSKLTFLLKDSLGGSSVTRLLACVNPCQKYYLETLSTIKFASRAKVLRLKAVQNETQGGSLQFLKQELRKAKDQLMMANTTILELRSTWSKKQQTLTLSSRKLQEEDFQGKGQFQERMQLLVRNEMNLRGLLILRGREEKCEIQKRLQQLFLNVPTFTSIYSQNLRLKDEIKNIRVNFQQSLDSSRHFLDQTKVQEMVGLLRGQVQKAEVQKERLQQALCKAEVQAQHFKQMCESLLARNFALTSQKHELQSQLQDQIASLQSQLQSLLELKLILPQLEEGLDLQPLTHLSLSRLSQHRNTDVQTSCADDLSTRRTDSFPLEEELSRLLGQVEWLKRDKKQLQYEIDQLKAMLLNQGHEACKQESQQRLSELRAEVYQLKDEVGCQQARIAKLQAQKKELEEALGIL